MAVQISEVTGMEFHINTWVDDDDYLVLVASLFPSKSHPIPPQAQVNLSLLFLEQGNALNSRELSSNKLSRPANGVEYDYLSFVWDEKNLKYASMSCSNTDECPWT